MLVTQYLKISKDAFNSKKLAFVSIKKCWRILRLSSKSTFSFMECFKVFEKCDNYIESQDNGKVPKLILL